MTQPPNYESLYDSYFPFRLYADYKRGTTVQTLASRYSMPVQWIEERVEAVRLCLEKQIRIEFAPAGVAA
jgi:hypothetical protein